MRPVYQEKILPNLAYIGGNAEIMYWLELKDYFSKIEIPFPILIPRNSMLFIKEKTLGKIRKLDLGIDDFFQNFAIITNRKILKDNHILPLLEEKEQRALALPLADNLEGAPVQGVEQHAHSCQHSGGAQPF